ncbi:hypothetical protein NX794_18180 [Streptomyces sp. LP11]|uniref:Uncharacterized protein n=1 Tax=Streptomyces pyxinicus TaxID=2970331 RepID=A0ABT2B3X1_9ACTN|nr:hypothetical protein [Streptomyces sp. LP11]MCS0603125.1 hypothetical protein [Streptomyces sp. LP11]
MAGGAAVGVAGTASAATSTHAPTNRGCSYGSFWGGCNRGGFYPGGYYPGGYYPSGVLSPGVVVVVVG